MSHALQTFRQLGSDERRLFLLALLLLPVLHGRLRLCGLQRTQTWLARRLGPRRTRARAAGVGRDAAVRTAWLVGAARRRVRWVNCLSEALVLDGLLRHQGLASDLRVGVRKSAGAVEAHAWVEHTGAPLGRQAPGEPFRALQRADGA